MLADRISCTSTPDNAAMRSALKRRVVGHEIRRGQHDLALRRWIKRIDRVARVLERVRRPAGQQLRGYVGIADGGNGFRPAAVAGLDIPVAGENASMCATTGPARGPPARGWGSRARNPLRPGSASPHSRCAPSITATLRWLRRSMRQLRRQRSPPAASRAPPRRPCASAGVTRANRLGAHGVQQQPALHAACARRAPAPGRRLRRPRRRTSGSTSRCTSSLALSMSASNAASEARSRRAARPRCRGA